MFGNNRGCLTNSLLFLALVFVPVFGQIVETFMILEDDHSSSGKVLWLIVVWVIPFVGPFLYLMFGQRPVRRAPVTFGQASQYGEWPQSGYRRTQGTF